MIMRLFLLLVAAIGAIHVRENCLAIGRFVECLRRTRAFGMF